MPRRTNEFQELVSLVCKAYARAGDTIEDSAMVKVQGLETEREIDILHTTSEGLFKIKIAVEAKDEARPIDLETFDSLYAKYKGEGRVQVDKFVIVSRNGFTGGVREKAKLADVTLMTLDEAKGADWASVCPTCPGELRPAGTARFQMPPHLHDIRVDPPFPPEVAAAVVREGVVVCSCCGKNHGSLAQYAWCCTLGRCDAVGDDLRKKLAEGLRQHPAGALFKVKWTLCPKLRVRHAGVDYKVDTVEITVHAADAVMPVRCTPYRMTSTDGCEKVFPHFHADFGDMQFRWIMPDGPKSQRILFDIRHRGQPPRKERRRQQSEARRAAKKVAKASTVTGPSSSQQSPKSSSPPAT